MDSTFFTLKRIWQKDNHTFVIEWDDGSTFDYRLSKLQEHCPCAGCLGKEKRSCGSLKEDVRARKIVSVGSYGIKIEFTRGCSMGIYSFEMLRKFSEVFS